MYIYIYRERERYTCIYIYTLYIYIYIYTHTHIRTHLALGSAPLPPPHHNNLLYISCCMCSFCGGDIRCAVLQFRVLLDGKGNWVNESQLGINSQRLDRRLSRRRAASCARHRHLCKKHSSGEEYTLTYLLSDHQIRGWRAVSAAGLHGKGLRKGSDFSQTPVSARSTWISTPPAAAEQDRLRRERSRGRPGISRPS